MYLTKCEIYQLKTDLMSRSLHSRTRVGRSTTYNSENYSADKISDIVAKEIKKIKNGETGLVFEENIRKTLEYEYNWKTASIPRHFFYRVVIFKGKSYYLSSFRIIKANKFTINMDPETNACLFIDKLNEKNTLEIGENETISPANFHNNNFLIGPPKEMEMDGLYENFDFNELPFDENEVEILFDNSPLFKYKYAVIEVKLNANKITELIDQLKEDQKIMEEFFENNSVIYLGFVNLNKSDLDEIDDSYFSTHCGNLNCILFGIKNGVFCERIITNPCDWKLVKQFYAFKKEIKDEIGELKEELRNFKEELKNFIEELKNFKEEIGEVIQMNLNHFQSKKSQTNSEFLQKKRKKNSRKK